MSAPLDQQRLQHEIIYCIFWTPEHTSIFFFMIDSWTGATNTPEWLIFRKIWSLFIQQLNATLTSYLLLYLQQKVHSVWLRSECNHQRYLKPQKEAKTINTRPTPLLKKKKKLLVGMHRYHFPFQVWVHVLRFEYLTTQLLILDTVFPLRLESHDSLKNNTCHYWSFFKSKCMFFQQSCDTLQLNVACITRHFSTKTGVGQLKWWLHHGLLLTVMKKYRAGTVLFFMSMSRIGSYSSDGRAIKWNTDLTSHS